MQKLMEAVGKSIRGPQRMLVSHGSLRFLSGGPRGAIHLLEKAYEIFSEQKDSYGFLMDFS